MAEVDVKQHSVTAVSDNSKLGCVCVCVCNVTLWHVCVLTVAVNMQQCFLYVAELYVTNVKILGVPH
jgi:hypothetical protein